MNTYDRREFFGEIIKAQMDKNGTSKDDPIFTRYANKELPKVARTTSTLNQYTGAWTDVQVRHLLRRTTFGIKESDVQLLLSMSMSDAVDHLLMDPAIAPDPPLNNYNTNNYTDPTGVATGQTWVNAVYGTGDTDILRRSSYKSWWLGLILNQDLSIVEKMVFFWHNHFATQVAVVEDARLSYVHNSLLRSNALGNYKALVKAITTDPSMLIYLNGYQNTANSPDENYGRELQELFTIGKYSHTTYTEDDVKAASKVLTGWRINRTTLSAFFLPAQHDISNKQFSSFYNNTLITGKSGSAGTNEIDTLIEMIFQKEEVAHFICTKLYRFFIYYDINTDIDTNIIIPLAQLLIDNNFEIKPVLACLFKSEHFYDADNIGCYIKTPLDFLVGTFKTFNIVIPSGTGVNDTYSIWNYVRSYGAFLGLDLGDPPNVAGWQPFYEAPQYYEIWINSSTFPLRMAFTDMIANSGFDANTNVVVSIDILGYFKQLTITPDPDALINYLCSLLFGVSVSQTEVDNLKGILLSGQANNNYWTQAWNDYISSPDESNTNIVSTRLSGLLTTMLRLPEYQLC